MGPVSPAVESSRALFLRYERVSLAVRWRRGLVPVLPELRQVLRTGPIAREVGLRQWVVRCEFQVPVLAPGTVLEPATVRTHCSGRRASPEERPLLPRAS